MDYGNQTAQCVKQSPIQEQHTRLDSLIASLHQELDKLLGRLEPVRRISPAGIGQEKCPPNPPASNYTNFLREKCSQVEIAIIKISSLLDDVEV